MLISYLISFLPPCPAAHPISLLPLARTFAILPAETVEMGPCCICTVACDAAAGLMPLADQTVGKKELTIYPLWP